MRDRLIDLLLALQEVLDSIAPDARDIVERIEREVEHDDDPARRVMIPVVPFAAADDAERN